ncbi:MAG TPA: cell division protein ZapA [Oleiagrimonas sp.]|nr:cell division protein ZapA [Oleiagrimonas sp.]
MTEPVSIKLGDREFLVACEPEERDGLLEAAAFLDARMRKLRHASKSPGFDRLAVLAAVDIAHELLDLRQHQQNQGSAMVDSLARLRVKLETVLEQAPTPL